MAEPSRLPSAVDVARRCFGAYITINPDIPRELAENLEALADYFMDRSSFLTVFVPAIIPWNDLINPPNKGHEAIADFLLTAAVDHAVTTNFDWLIERAVWERFGGYFIASLDGEEAAVHATHHRPLIKLHGCANREPMNTLWTRRQLANDPFVTRTGTLLEWLSVNLRAKDLVIVGFWSDWPHLTDVLERTLRGSQPSSVTVVDPAPAEALERKGPDLWRALNGDGFRFEHIRMSADIFLDDLREAFSRMYVRGFLQMGTRQYEEVFGEACPPEWLQADDIPREQLYEVRRDAEGQPMGRPARNRTPPPHCERFAFYLLVLRRRGAQREGQFYRFQYRLLRVINGPGESLNSIKARYACEPPTTQQADVVACVGAENDVVPAHIVRGGSISTMVRPSVRGNWLDGHQTRALLGL